MTPNENRLKNAIIKKIDVFKQDVDTTVTFEVKIWTGGCGLDEEVVKNEVINNCDNVKSVYIEYIGTEDEVEDTVSSGYWGDEIYSYYKVTVSF